jgi:hypothetical protein
MQEEEGRRKGSQEKCLAPEPIRFLPDFHILPFEISMPRGDALCSL